jgi:hypothetical protein
VRERADLDARSRAGISELIGPLTAEQRDQLVAAQAQVRRLLRLAAVDDGASVARYCLRAYASELAVRFPEGYDDSTLAKPGELAGDAGALLVAREEGRPAGCVVWRRSGRTWPRSGTCGSAPRHAGSGSAGGCWARRRPTPPRTRSR